MLEFITNVTLDRIENVANVMLYNCFNCKTKFVSHVGRFQFKKQQSKGKREHKFPVYSYTQITKIKHLK